MNWARAHRSLIVGVLIMASAALLVAVSQVGLLVASAANSFPRGSIDSPASGVTVSGGFNVTGWAVDLGSANSTGVDKVSIFVDGAYYGDALYGRTRNDLAGFGPQFVPSGFLYVLDSNDIGGGTHTIEARARSTISTGTTAYSRTVIVNAPPATPRATATPTATAVNTATPVPGTTATATPTAAPPTATPTAAPPTTFPKQFGMNAHLTWYDLPHATIDVDRIKNAGLSSVRFDVTWRVLEPDSKGTYNAAYLAELDGALAIVRSRGLKSLLVMLDTPAWARGGLGSEKSPPTNMQDYADTYAFLAARYNSLPNMAYEVWNEPNQIVFWDTPSGPDALAYAGMLKKTYTSIKAVAPSATVVVGAIAENDTTYLQSLFTFGGIHGFYDVFSVHTYCDMYSPISTADGYRTFTGLLQQTVSLMSQYGDQSKPIWITEFGWNTSTQVTEETRGQYVRQAVDVAKSFPQVAQVLAYSEDQADDPGFGMISSLGILTNSFLSYSLAASVPNSAGSNVRGSIDSPQEWATPNNSGTLSVSGWAVDLGSPGPGVSAVQVYIDYAFIGNATYGGSRGDIGSVYGAGFANSGFVYPLNLASVAVGYHTLEVRATSSVTGATTSYSRPITVKKIASAPRGSIDSPGNGTTWRNFVPVSGWAIDTSAPTGTGVDAVAIYFDNVFRANAVYGGARADIGAAFGPRFTNSRFAYTLDLTGVPAGTHTVTAHAHETQTGLEVLYTSTITVVAP